MRTLKPFDLATLTLNEPLDYAMGGAKRKTVRRYNCFNICTIHLRISICCVKSLLTIFVKDKLCSF